MLDYGCGSGILAIARGAAFGAPTSMRSTSTRPRSRRRDANARANGVALRAGLPDAAPGRYPLVLANILATPLKLLAPLLCGASWTPAATLVLAGILERQADELSAAYAPWLALDVADGDDGWILMAGKRGRDAEPHGMIWR